MRFQFIIPGSGPMVRQNITGRISRPWECAEEVVYLMVDWKHQSKEETGDQPGISFKAHPQ
jgi:hypothetical protein